MRNFGLMVAASFLTLGAVGIAAPAMAQEATASGMTLARADYDGGYFAQGQGGAWTEYQGSRVMYHFREIARDANSVTLLDASRDTRIQFDLARQMIRVSWSKGSPFEDLYPLTDATARPGNPVPLPSQLHPVPAPGAAAALDYDSQVLFKVDAGPITSDAQAAAKCPALAMRVHGVWSQGWERRDGVHSVCVLSFAR